MIAFECIRPPLALGQARYEYTAIHMAVPVHIVLYAPTDAEASDAARAAFQRIAELEEVMSDYRPTSELRHLEETPHIWRTVSQDLFNVLARAVEVACLTDGAFDPTVGSVVRLWREARSTGTLPSGPSMASALSLVGWEGIDLDEEHRAVRLRREGIQLDLGGIAKGYILQEALSVLRDRGLSRVLIEAGGDIVVGDAPPGRPGWEVALPESVAPSFAERAKTLTNSALSTSGGTKQFVEIDGVRYSHVVDPRTGTGMTHHLVVHVIAPDGATTDALSTALNVTGIDGVNELLEGFPGTLVAIHSADEP